MEDDLFNAFEETSTLTSKDIEEINSRKINNHSNKELYNESNDMNILSTNHLKRKIVDTDIKSNIKKDITNQNKDNKENNIYNDDTLHSVKSKYPKVKKTVHIDSSSADDKHVATGTQQKNLIAYSALPDNYIQPKPPTGPPVKTYPFTLDPFQQQAINYIECGESVLVSAHTSAGKTAIAEYAIAKSLRDKQRVIYTSPIKALSNQKYRDLEQEFGDVGLMTGDISINPTATCLVMTTEILRSMLYRGSEVMREVAWVIYDEIHYMRDRERGVVWEESIILLPHKVRFVFLSATIPNSKQFAAWICHIHQQPCHVVYTDYRPTPLQHFVYLAGGDGLHLVVDETGKFRENNFQEAMAILSSLSNNSSQSLSDDMNKKKKKLYKRTNKKEVGSSVFRIVKLLMERKYDPIIIFSFSKKDCESYALLLSKLDFNTKEEKEMVEQVFNNAMDSLSEDDKHLPQVDNILPLLQRGIGIHHGGILPIIKEVIEIMFGEGLIKCLFATETFSMGLNMPAKTVVFTACKKFDGKELRWITSGEYIQMSGRAGRRSLDTRGIVIQMLDEEMEPQVAKDILYGKADPLYSTFHIGYNMLLNLLRVEDADPEYLIKQSFHQFQNEQSEPILLEELDETHKKINNIIIPNENEYAEVYYLSEKLHKIKENIRQIINKPENCLPFLNDGRLVKIKDATNEWDWGIIINYEKIDKKIILHVLLNCASQNYLNSIKTKDLELKKKLIPAPIGSLGGSPSAGGEMKICPTPLTLIDKLSSVRLRLPKDLKGFVERQQVGKAIAEVLRRFSNAVPLLDPINDMKIVSKDEINQDNHLNNNKDNEYLIQLQEYDIHQNAIHENRIYKAMKIDKDPKIIVQYELYEKKVELENKIRIIKLKIQETRSLVLKDDLRHRKRVLRQLEFTNRENIIQLKGRTACEISTVDILLVTELLFHGIFNDLSVNESAALLSCFISQDKKQKNKGNSSSMSISSNPTIEKALFKVKEIATTIAKTMAECKLDISTDAYIEEINDSMVDIVLAWCQGAKFSQIMKMTDIFEGTIIRNIRSLDELLRQLTMAAIAMGNKELEDKFRQASEKIKRDIVFAASLYL